MIRGTRSGSATLRAPPAFSVSSCSRTIPPRPSLPSSRRSISSASAPRGAGSRAWRCPSTARRCGAQRNGCRGGRRCACTSASRIPTILPPISNAAFRDSRSPDARLRRAKIAALSHDEIEIAHIDEHAEGLAGDEDGITAIERVGEQQEAAGDRKKPKCDRNYASSLPLAFHPLHPEAPGEHELGDEAEDDPPVKIGDKHVEQVGPDHPL